MTADEQLPRFVHDAHLYDARRSIGFPPEPPPGAYDAVPWWWGRQWLLWAETLADAVWAGARLAGRLSRGRRRCCRVAGPRWWCAGRLPEPCGDGCDLDAEAVAHPERTICWCGHTAGCHARYWEGIAPEIRWPAYYRRLRRG
jgi:hypothetical protein